MYCHKIEGDTMDEIQTYINILTESLDKKIEILKQLLELTTNQSQLISKEKLDLDQFDHIMDNKSKWIEEINLLDHGFSSTYDRVRHALVSNKANYKEPIKGLQEKVSIVSELTVNIQVAEERNKNDIQRHLKKNKNKVKTFKKSRKTASQYYKTMNNMYGNESYFIDKKK